MLFQTFLLADFRFMYIIQPAACTAVEKKQNDMLIDHLCQDFLLILNVLGVFFPFSYSFVLLGSSKFSFTVLFNNVIEVG